MNLCTVMRQILSRKPTVPVPLAARAKSQVCGRSPAEIVGSNPTGGMEVCLLWVLCVVQVEVSATSWSLVQRSPADCGGSLWSRKLMNVETMAHTGVVAPNKKQQPALCVCMSRILDTYPLNHVARNLLLQHDTYTENRVSCKIIFSSLSLSLSLPLTLQTIALRFSTFRIIRTVQLTFWHRNYFFLILAHPVYKMWIIQEPNTLELWNKLHLEEEKNGEYIPCLKYSVPIFVE